MGAWFANFLKKNGYRVAIYDTNSREARALAQSKGFTLVQNLETAMRSGQLIVLATPTRVTKSILERTNLVLPSKALIVEISSVKTTLKKALQELNRKGANVLSIHPMFGPGIRGLQGNIILTTCVPAGNVMAQKLLSDFRRHGAIVVRSNYEEHEKLISVLLTLPHFLNIAMVNTLRHAGFDVNRLRMVAGTTFRLQLLAAEAILQENANNEASILVNGGRSLKILERYTTESYSLLRVIKKRNRSGLMQRLEEGRAFVKKDRLFPTAYHRFNAAVQASNQEK
jgi:prephenate dehydrogenase